MTMSDTCTHALRVDDVRLHTVSGLAGCIFCERDSLLAKLAAVEAANAQYQSRAAQTEQLLADLADDICGVTPTESVDESIARITEHDLDLRQRLAAAEAARDELDDGEGLLDKVRRLCKSNEALRDARNELADMCDEYERTLSKLGHYDGCDTDVSGTARIAELRKAGKQPWPTWA